MSTAAIEAPPGVSRPIYNNKRKADDADLDPHADAGRLRGPIKVVEVAPGGDVLIKVRRPGWDDYEESIDSEDDDGPDAIDIIVSSEVLCSKSRMFKRMLEGSFIEAQTKTIHVEEDSPTVFLGFCEILHDVFDNSIPIDRSWFVEFLKIVDMRDAIPSVESWVKDRLHEHFQRIDILKEQPWSQRQLRLKNPFRGIRNGVRDIKVTDVMITAAVFRFERIFVQTSVLCLLNIPMGGREDAGDIYDNVPACVDGKRLKDELCEAAKREWSELEESIGYYFSQMEQKIQKESFGSLRYRLRMDRNLHEARNGFQSAGLCDSHWTESLVTASNTISEICARLPRDFGLRNGAAEFEHEDYLRDESCKVHPCWQCREDISSDVRGYVNDYLEFPQGLCLPCFTNGADDFGAGYPHDLEHQARILRSYTNEARWKEQIDLH